WGGGWGVDGRTGERWADGLEVADRLAELHAVRRPRGRRRQQVLSGAGQISSQRNVADGRRVRHRLERGDPLQRHPTPRLTRHRIDRLDRPDWPRRPGAFWTVLDERLRPPRPRAHPP